MPKYTVVDAVELRSHAWVTVMLMARFMSLKHQKSRDRFGVTLAAAYIYIYIYIYIYQGGRLGAQDRDKVSSGAESRHGTGWTHYTTRLARHG